MLFPLVIVVNWAQVTLALWNSAQWKPTSQSGTLSYGYSKNAVDGNKNGVFRQKSCTHTTRNSSSWWMVDLLGLYHVKQVNIVNRNRYGKRLTNFRIEFYETDPRHETQFPNVIGRTCATQGNAFLPRGDNIFSCAPGTVGRFGMVVMHKDIINYLTICEFEALVDDADDRMISYERSENVRATDGVFLSWQSIDLLSCAAECNSRRDKELCTAFNWNQERRECHLLSVSPYKPVNQISEVGWSLYRTISH